MTKIEAVLEIVDSGYAGANDLVLTPVVYGLLGKGLYAGVGTGISYADGGFADSPFFACPAGWAGSRGSARCLSGLKCQLPL